MIQAFLLRAMSGVNVTMIFTAAAVAMSGYAGWKVRDTTAAVEIYELQLAHAGERSQLANSAIRERDNALEKTRQMNLLASAAEQQARRDRERFNKILGVIDNAPPLPADCRLDNERLRQLREAP